MEIYEGDIRKWIASIADSEKHNVAAQTFLKSSIETRNPVFNKMIRGHRARRHALDRAHPALRPHRVRQVAPCQKNLSQLRYNKGLVPGVFVEVNCATLQGESVLSNLFGHVRGSFTGATTVRQGLLRTAHQGILFLDEIAEIPLQIQVILLKAIEEKMFYPFGSDTPVHSDFQLICGTNRNLDEEVRQGRFRLDLLSRINMWHFRLPALRERLEDIEPNINYELDRHTRLKGFKADFLPKHGTRSRVRHVPRGPVAGQLPRSVLVHRTYAELRARGHHQRRAGGRGNRPAARRVARSGAGRGSLDPGGRRAPAAAHDT
ncbi:MAG: sigma 54-interacting transcriptional regulator [Bilophila sp.]